MPIAADGINCHGSVQSNLWVHTQLATESGIGRIKNNNLYYLSYDIITKNDITKPI